MFGFQLNMNFLYLNISKHFCKRPKNVYLTAILMYFQRPFFIIYMCIFIIPFLFSFQTWRNIFVCQANINSWIILIYWVYNSILSYKYTFRVTKLCIILNLKMESWAWFLHLKCSLDQETWTVCHFFCFFTHSVYRCGPKGSCFKPTLSLLCVTGSQKYLCAHWS